jgi:GNAT superfamily N-acetyltransferase
MRTSVPSWSGRTVSASFALSTLARLPVVEFRAEDASQAPAADLVAAMVAEMEPLYGRIDVPEAPSASAADFSPPGGVFLVGYDDDGTVLCGGGVKRLDAEAAEIKRMYVIPSARGRGLAKELLRALEDAARSLGYTIARLDTGAKQPHAERMYRDAGYRDIGNFNANPFASFWGEKRL